MVSTRRLVLVGVFFVLFIGLVYGRTLSFHFTPSDVRPDDYYSAVPVGSNEIKALRGMITDRGGNVLVTTRLVLNARARTVLVNDGNRKDAKGEQARKPALVMTDTAAVAAGLATLVGQSPAALKPKLDAIAANYGSGQYGSTLIAANIAVTATDVYSRTAEDLRRRGIEFEEGTVRAYPQGDLAGPLLGFVSMQPRGYGGVEGYYDPRLRGQEGRVVRRGLIDLITATLETDGAAIQLTIDSVLQSMVEDRLQKAVDQYKATGGTIIVMDSRTGAVYASASLPTFHPARAIDIATASTDGIDKLRDPAVTDAYEPGSVMKLVTIAAALDAGTITPQSVYVDTGRFDAGGSIIRNSDNRAYGRVDLEQVLVHSLNVVSAQIARDMTPPTFYRYINLFGFGQRTGIDLANETAGIVRTPSDAQWTKADLTTNSYGQGIAVSPLQLVNAINVIANGGTLLQPYVVQEIRYPDGRVVTSKPVQTKRVIAPEAAAEVRRLAASATQEATPKALVTGYTLAGKTGTANWYQRGKKADTTIHTFIGMIPATEPRLTIMVKLDEPKVQYAKDSTVPVFHDVAERAVQILGVPPDIVK